MTSRRVSLTHSHSMFQTSTGCTEASLYRSSASKPPIFRSCHAIAPRRSSICVPSQSLTFSVENARRGSSSEGVQLNKRLSGSTHGTRETQERKQSIAQLSKRKLSVANISEQLSSFFALSTKASRLLFFFL